MALEENPFAACPISDTTRLAALYDNNADERNRADLVRLRAKSAEGLAAVHGLHQTLRLGPGPTDWIDLVMPTSAPDGPVPALLFVHGGRWTLNTSRETSFWARACADSGMAFVGLNFPPLGERRMAGLIDAVVDAIERVVARASALGLDPHALALAGHSSGAHLAVAAVLSTFDRADVGTPGAFRAMLLLGGMYDLRPLRLGADGATTFLSEEDVQVGSPLLTLARATGTRRLPPAMVAVGESESSEFIRQARALHWQLSGHGDARLHIVPGAAHFDAPFEFDRPDSVMRRFIERHLLSGTVEAAANVEGRTA